MRLIGLGAVTALVTRFRQCKRPEELHEIPKVQRRSLAKTLAEYQDQYAQRDEVMARAYLSGVYTTEEIGKFFGVHYMTVSRAVRKHESNS